MPRPAPIAASLLIHGAVLAWVAFVPPGSPAKPKSLYQSEFAPHEKKLVWYRFNEKLPEVSPAKPDAGKDPRPLRAAVKRPKQTIVSKTNRPDPAKQMTLAPGPELNVPKELDSPNLLAFKMPEPPAPPDQPKPFTPPPEAPPPSDAPKLEAAPEIAARIPPEAPADIPVPKPPPRPFTPPPQVAKQVEPPHLQPGEAVAVPAVPDGNVIASLPRPARPEPKPFTPPPQAARATAAPVGLAAGPVLSAQAPRADAVAGLVPQPARPQPKLFAPPPSRSGNATASKSPVLDIPPTLASNLNVAVVGLNPTDRIPQIPDGSRPAQFSAAPEISPSGGDAAPVKSANIVVSDLMIRGGEDKGKQQLRESIARLVRVEPTSKENLLASVRPAIPRSAPMASMKSLPAVRVGAAPDPRLDGRVVYTVAIQMPNVTSYSGSWILWYADRRADGSDVSEVLPPEPLRKVDPVYDISATEDRIEGKVQLAAIIHTDGYVYGINVVKGVDPRLDKSAVEALRKWEFTPARREGAPVDVDIVIEIPFRLRPLKVK